MMTCGGGGGRCVGDRLVVLVIVVGDWSVAGPPPLEP